MLKSLIPLVDKKVQGGSLTEASLRQFLSPDEKRIRHSLGVLRLARQLAEQIFADNIIAENLQTAALFHDVGYSPLLQKTGFHPLDGALFLASQSAPDAVVAAVLWHSGAQSEADCYPKVKAIYEELHDFRAGFDDIVDALTFCDIRTLPDGQMTTLQERISDITYRYGKDHEVSQSFRGQSGSFYTCIDRIRKRVRLHAANPLPWLFADVDNTIVVPGQGISPRNMLALKMYATAGGKCSMATGKHPAAIQKLTDGLNLPGPHIAINGGVIIEKGVLKVLNSLGSHSCSLQAKLETEKIPHVLYTPEEIIISSRFVAGKHLSQLAAIDEPLPVAASGVVRQRVIKILCFIPEKDTIKEKLLRLIGNELGLRVLRTAATFVEFVPADAGKHRAMRCILAGASWPSIHTIALGDNENDADMLREAGYSVAVANACPTIRKLCDLTVGSCADDGAGHYINSLMENLP